MASRDRIGRFPDFKIAWFVPRLTLREQGATGLKQDFGIDVFEADNTQNPSKGSRGFVATHAALTADHELYEKEFRRNRYILIVDEFHHAKILKNENPNKLASALNKLRPISKVVMKMTGTLDSNDGSKIWEVIYGDDRKPIAEESANILVRYTRKEALQAHSLVPMEFEHVDGPVRYITNGEEVNGRISDDVNEKGVRDRIFTALEKGQARELLGRCVSHFRDNGQKMIVVCNVQRKAEEYHKMLLKDMGFQDVGAGHHGRPERKRTSNDSRSSMEVATSWLLAPWHMRVLTSNQ